MIQLGDLVKWDQGDNQYFVVVKQLPRMGLGDKQCSIKPWSNPGSEIYRVEHSALTKILSPLQAFQRTQKLQADIDILKATQEKILESANDCPTPPMYKLRGAMITDIVPGNVIWYPSARNRWKIVAHIKERCNPWSSAFIAHDGTTNGLDGAYVEAELLSDKDTRKDTIE